MRRRAPGLGVVNAMVVATMVAGSAATEPIVQADLPSHVSP